MRLVVAHGVPVRVIIAGGRNYFLTPEDRRRLTALRDTLPISEVVCGGAPGADAGGRAWAIEYGVPVKEFPAAWDRLGRSAGPARNQRMVEYADALVVFPGGRGTTDVTGRARARGLRVYYEGRRT